MEHFRTWSWTLHQKEGFEPGLIGLFFNPDYTSYGIFDLSSKSGFEGKSHTKTANNVETIFQMLAAYVWHTVLPAPPALKFLFTPFLVAPLNMLGIALGMILPSDETLYQSNVVLCRKVGPPPGEVAGTVRTDFGVG